MIFMHFTSQIILLAIGFGVGYWILITANKHEGRLKIIGETLGWILIAMAILSALFSCYYTMKLASGNYPEGCPINRMMHRPMVEDEDTAPQTDQNTPLMDNQKSGEKIDIPVAPQVTEERPIRRDIKDHE